MRHGPNQRRIARAPVARVLCALGLAILPIALCSCRSMPRAKLAHAELAQRTGEAASATPAMHEEVMASDEHLLRAAETTPHIPAACLPDAAPPIPLGCNPPWSPPGIAGPWPLDEYLFDGGDRDIAATVDGDRDVHGLELEDTVAVYDTIDGETKIKASNRVCLYAPRFAAVRQVSGVVQNEQRDQPIGVVRPLAPILHQDDQLVTTAVQPIQPEGEIGRKQPSIQRLSQAVIKVNSRLPIMALAGGFSPHEDFLAIRQGLFQEAERARLAEAVTAAIAWTHDAAVQVVLEGQQAVSVTGDQKAQATFRIDTPNSPCLRVLKVASTKNAKPGDIVDFTIRFDNLGDQTINKVVLIDNLTTRLEYVLGTAQSSRKAEFSTEENQGESLVLKWEFADPLPPGHGGLVRFHCKVR
jgi:uncharacterized repeat protein (TIGR01451 family)